MELTGWKDFICQKEKWNERISVCYRIRTGNAELSLSVWLLSHSLKDFCAILSLKWG